MSEKVILTDLLKPVFSSEGPKSHWFGYYNYSPISADGTKLLSHEVNFDGRDIQSDDTSDIGWYDLKDGTWHKVATTHAINWQQGSMLQWLGPDFNTRVIFNDVEDGHFVSRIYDTRTGELEKTIPFAIYGVTPDGKTSISLQFERSYWCRAYHYESVANSEWDGLVASGDGIFSVDIVTGEVKRILTIEEIIEKSGWKAGDNEKQWIEHIMLNRSGTAFAFYYRCGDKTRFSKTVGFVAPLDGSGLEIMPLPEDCDPSHLGWVDDGMFVVYCYALSRMVKKYSGTVRTKSLKSRIIVGFVRKVIKKMLPGKVVKAAKGSAYYVLVDRKEGKTDRLPIMQLPEDGHPSFTADGRFMLTDTYADKDGYRHLLIYDMQKGHAIELGKFYSPFNCCGYRADLHPRFSRDEKRVIIDSAHTGQHQVHVFDLNWNRVVC